MKIYKEILDLIISIWIIIITIIIWKLLIEINNQLFQDLIMILFKQQQQIHLIIEIIWIWIWIKILEQLQKLQIVLIITIKLQELKNSIWNKHQNKLLLKINQILLILFMELHKNIKLKHKLKIINLFKDKEV